MPWREQAVHLGIPMDIQRSLTALAFSFSSLFVVINHSHGSMNHDFAVQTGKGTTADLFKLPSCFDEIEPEEIYINQITGQQVSKQFFTSHEHQFSDYRKMYCCQHEIKETDFKVIHQADNGQIYLNLSDIAEIQYPHQTSEKIIAQGTILEKSLHGDTFTVLTGDHPQHRFNDSLQLAENDEQLNDVTMNPRNSVAQRMSAWFLQTKWPHLTANEYAEGVTRKSNSSHRARFKKTQNRRISLKIGERFSVKELKGALAPEENSICKDNQNANCEHGQVYSDSNGVEFKAYTDPIPANDTIRPSQYNAFQKIEDYDIAFTRSGAKYSNLLRQFFFVEPKNYFDWIDFVFSDLDKVLLESDEYNINEYQAEVESTTLKDLAVLISGGLQGNQNEEKPLAPFATKILALHKMISWVSPLYHTYKNVPRKKLRKIFNSLNSVNLDKYPSDKRIKELTDEDLYILMGELSAEKRLLDEQNCGVDFYDLDCRNFTVGKTLSTKQGRKTWGASNYHGYEMRVLLSGQEKDKGGNYKPWSFFGSNNSLNEEDKAHYSEIVIGLLARYADAHIREEPRELHPSGNSYNTDYRYIVDGVLHVISFEYHLRQFIDTAAKELVKTNVFRVMRNSENKVVKRVCKIADKRKNMPRPYMKSSRHNRSDIVLIPAFGNKPIYKYGVRSDNIALVGIYGENDDLVETIENGHNRKIVARSKIPTLIAFNKSPLAIYIPVKSRIHPNDNIVNLTKPTSLSKIKEGVWYNVFNWANVMALPKQSLYLRNILRSLNTPNYWKLKHDGHEDSLQEMYARKTRVVGGHIATDDMNPGSTGDNPADDIYFSDLNIWFGPGMVYLDTPTLGSSPDPKITEVFGQGPYNSYKYVSSEHLIGENDVDQANSVVNKSDVTITPVSLTSDDLVGALNFSVHGIHNGSDKNASRIRSVRKVRDLAKEYKSESFLKPMSLCSHLRAAELVNRKTTSGYFVRALDRHDHPKLQFGDFYWKGNGKTHSTRHKDKADHLTHLSGVCVDYRYGSKSDEIRNVPMYWKNNARNGSYDKHLSREFIKIFKDVGASIIISADKYHSDNEGVELDRGGYKYNNKHNTHLHVCFSDYIPMTPAQWSKGFARNSTSIAFTDPESKYGIAKKRLQKIDRACSKLGTGI